MNPIEQTEARRQQAHRRLSELEVAVQTGGESGLAWHIRQALRSGASRAEVADALRLGMKMRGPPTAVLTQCVHDVVKKVFHTRSASWLTRQPTVESLSQC